MIQATSVHREDIGYSDMRNDGVMDMDEPDRIVSDPAGWKHSRVAGSSCQALRHAVAALNRLDDFTSEKIGSGFFSEVFKVTHRTTGQVMVLKKNLLRANRPNMLKEVQLMNQMSHPNILRFMGVCVHEGQLHALTEYLNGGSLEQLVQARGVDLPYAVRMRLALDIARGMEYLHSRGVFHRDLTSKNVLIRRNEETGELTAVVADFGLAAKIPDPESEYRLPTVGSPYWMSPECLKGQRYNEKSDVFSYGIVLCELIARVDADPDVLPRTQNFGLDYLAFTALCPPACPPYFLRLAFHCCTFEPQRRPPFSEIVRKLEEMLRVSRGSVDDSGPLPLPLALVPHLPAVAAEACVSPSLSARSVEVIPTIPGDSKLPSRHKKLTHRRSLSEDVGLMASFPSHTTPSDKARCHFLGAALQGSRLTAKHVGESMFREDPHYRPSEKGALNPFAALAHFRGVKKILGDKGDPSTLCANLACSGDLFSSCFELPSPFYNATPLSYPPSAAEGTLPETSKKQQHGRKACAGPPFTVPSADLLGTTKQLDCVPVVPPVVNAGVDMWCKVGSRWRLKSEVEENSARRTSSEMASPPIVKTCVTKFESNLVQGSIFPSHRAADDYLKMDSECNDHSSTNNNNNNVDRNSILCYNSLPPSSSVKGQPAKDADCCQRSACLPEDSSASGPGPRLGVQGKTWHRHQPQYLSLPSSPTFVRRRSVVPCTAINPRILMQRLLETQGKVRAASQPKSIPDEDSVFSGRSSVMDKRLPLQRRLSSSSSNLHSLLLAEEDGVPLGFPTVTLRRRGSCESGFFSSVGEDYGLPGCDPLSPSDFCSGPARLTLCSSSAASSLFLLDDSAVSTTTVSSGELADLDDLAPNGSGSCGLSARHHTSLLFTAKRSSSIYTDSSEDVSSLGGDPAYWEERGFTSNPAPQQISKIVEYFERKQTSTSSSGPGPSRRPSAKLQPQVDILQVSTTTRRFPIHPQDNIPSLNDVIRSTDSYSYSLFRKSLGSPKCSSSSSTPPVPHSRPHIAKRNTSQRLIICEGAVKSKLPLFDKK